MSLISTYIRFSWKRNDDKRDAGLTTPEDVVRLDALPYGPDPKWNVLDLYRPRDPAGKLPVIVSIHGGGYVYGSTVQYQFYGMSLAQLGFAVVSFNYRLAPEHKFPAPLEDTNRVMEWVLAHGEEYGMDTENIFLVGDSAGGQLASQYAVMWSNPAYAELMGIRPPRFPLRAVGLNCGVYDISRVGKAGGPANALNRDYFGKKPQVHGEKLKVLDYITADFPPAYLLSAPGDFLLPLCQPMAELLRSRGVETEWKLYGDEKTGHVFHVDQRSPYSAQANRDQTDFFKRHIKT